MRHGKTKMMMDVVKSQSLAGKTVLVLVPNEQSEANLLNQISDWPDEVRSRIHIKETFPGGVIPCEDPALVHLFEREQ